MRDITIVEGANELNVELVPIAPPVANLYGVVTDAQTGAQIQGVKLALDGLVTYTDSIGRYMFSGLNPGSYWIAYEKEDYQGPTAKQITLYEGDNELSVEMVPVAPPFDPWSYDFNGDGYIDTQEMLAAANDYFAGIITKDQVDQVTALWEATKPPEIHVEVVALDFNENDIVDGEDEAIFLKGYPSSEDDFNYDRRLDANFDGVIDDMDYDIFYGTLGKNLGAIRDSIKTGIYEHLVWPDGWDAYLVVLNKDMVGEFTGHGLNNHGWISIQLHPPLFSYLCYHFGTDTAVAAYKALGYGCLLFAATEGEAGIYGHAYNIFWVGGDWRNLNNWYILEPQSGKIFCAGQEGLPSTYQTHLIYCYDYVKTGISGKALWFHSLFVDYTAKTVAFGGPGNTQYFPVYPVQGVGFEEPVPDVFDRVYLVGA